MEKTQVDKYQELMEVIRSRFDSIDKLSQIGFDDFNNTEMAAFYGRKIIEGIAFACLIATKNGFKTIPKDAEGQYNAEKILKTLLRKGIETFPSPSIIRNTTEEEEKKYTAKVTVEGVAEKRITQEELIKKYQRLHNWAHELNPYVKEGHFEFNQKHRVQLEKDLSEIRLFLEKHFISINGEGFFCVLYDNVDGKTKVISLSKTEDLPED
ncbi:MAG: hypothetical protein LCH91_15460 [Bacteroidetes bacterium]|nr:hypothetical protein [Bacteroidota bacterium]